MKKGRKIAIVGARSYGGAWTVGEALLRFLVARGHNVTFIDAEEHASRSRLWWWYRHFCYRFLGWELASDYLESRLAQLIRDAKFEVVLAIADGRIILRDLGCLKIYFCHAPMAHEQYFKLLHYRARSTPGSIQYIDELRKTELEIFRRADYVTIAWPTYEKYIRTYVYDGPNIVSHPGKGWFGCTPAPVRARFCLPPAIVYLGGLERYFNNMALLARLTDSLSYFLDVYGSPAPASNYHLRYRGVMKNPATELINYQFGLNTVTREILRRNGFSSKVLTYLAHGLPCLFNEWEQFPHELGGCVPYNEDNINELIESFFDRTKWQELSDQAYAQAQELTWDKVLEPLTQLLE